MYGFLITSFNDAEEIVRAFKSLKTTIPPYTSYKVCIVDGGSRPDQIELLQREIGALAENEDSSIKVCPDLSVALNTGINRLLGFYESNISEFIEGKQDGAVDHVVWLHPDQKYYQPDWVGKLCQIYDYLWPLCGRLAPGTSNIDSSLVELNNNIAVTHSNNCPWVIGKEYVRKSLQKYGNVYDPRYIKIGACEDHDAWYRMLQDGMFVLRCNLVDVVHKGMWTRSLSDTRADQLHNREVFHSIWGQDIFPKIDFDLTEINNDLMNKFRYLKDEIISLIPERDRLNKLLNEELK